MTIDDQMRLAHELIQYEVLLGLVTDTMDDEPDLDDLDLEDDSYIDDLEPSGFRQLSEH